MCPRVSCDESSFIPYIGNLHPFFFSWLEFINFIDLYFKIFIYYLFDRERERVEAGEGVLREREMQLSTEQGGQGRAPSRDP